MQKVELRIELTRYLIIAVLSLPKRNAERVHSQTRLKESMNASYVKGLIMGLSHITEPVELHIIIRQGYLNIALRNIEKWIAEDFIKADGTEVKYKEMWKQAAELLDKHKWKVEMVDKNEKYATNDN